MKFPFMAGSSLPVSFREPEIVVPLDSEMEAAVGIGYSQHAGVVIVCDGTKEAARRIERVLWNDPATGVMRHADAGYDIAKQCAKDNHLNLPMLG